MASRRAPDIKSEAPRIPRVEREAQHRRAGCDHEIEAPRARASAGGAEHRSELAVSAGCVIIEGDRLEPMLDILKVGHSCGSLHRISGCRWTVGELCQGDGGDRGITREIRRIDPSQVDDDRGIQDPAHQRRSPSSPKNSSWSARNAA